MKVKLSRRARQDIEDIGRFIRARHPTAAIAVRDAIRASLDMLAVYPQAGREIGPAGLHRLVVPRLPYLIFYRPDVATDSLQIVTIRHAARDNEDLA